MYNSQHKSQMNPVQKLQLIKIIHTLIWFFFVTVIFYIMYSGICDKITTLTWVSIGLVLGEGVILLLFNMFCPLTVLARKYSSSTRDNFDIYLPEWLARYNKLIFTSIYLVGVLLIFYRIWEKH